MDELDGFSVGELAELAQHYGVIDAFERRGDNFILRLGSLELVLSEREVWPYLRGLIRGHLLTRRREEDRSKNE